MFEPEFEERVDAIVARYPASRAALLPVLWEVQRHDGWVSSQAESWVAGRLNVTPAHVHGAVTFYTMYKQRPTGRHHIQVCTTLTCMLRVAHRARRGTIEGSGEPLTWRIHGGRCRQDQDAAAP